MSSLLLASGVQASSAASIDSLPVSGTVWAWFCGFVAALLLLDLFVFNKEAHKVTVQEALRQSVFFILCALGVGGWIWWHFGHLAAAPNPELAQAKALEYLTGYLVELSLSVDNLFVFALLFRYFKVPAEYQHRVLFWGIFGAIVMRAIMIFAGVALVNRFEWLIPVFGAFLLYSGWKMLRSNDEADEADIDNSPVMRWTRKLVPVAPGLHGQRLFVTVNGKRMATRLFLVLVMVEFTDVIFAVDSIPAILGITRDQFIVFSSNIMAILGLRSLYFVLADFMDRFKYLHYGLALVLLFIGGKMIVDGVWHLHLPTSISLLVVAGLIGGSIVVSLRATKNTPADEAIRHALDGGNDDLNLLGPDVPRTGHSAYALDDEPKA
ncbi:MAG: TerC family protein [Rhodothermales bacterium]|nr:TerC family protein [Rhodothermales bacterium]